VNSEDVDNNDDDDVNSDTSDDEINIDSVADARELSAGVTCGIDAGCETTADVPSDVGNNEDADAICISAVGDAAAVQQERGSGTYGVSPSVQPCAVLLPPLPASPGVARAHPRCEATERLRLQRLKCQVEEAALDAEAKLAAETATKIHDGMVARWHRDADERWASEQQRVAARASSADAAQQALQRRIDAICAASMPSVPSLMQQQQLASRRPGSIDKPSVETRLQQVRALSTSMQS
jgi:hypothetical protein